ncbi:YaaC family protein [Shewanella xiamenensis]|uniref:YaaC family protein n=1 Tax=Shewanella xiamenensis TaxID=332186 RepID=UPI00313BC20E
MANKKNLLSQTVTRLSDDVSKIKSDLKENKIRPSTQCGKWPVRVYRPLIAPKLDSKVILTDSTWQFVEIYLKRNCSNSDAVFYWQQAKNFYQATKQLDLISKPLTTYYCFLNATKALLECKSINYHFSHGVSGKVSDGHKRLNNELVRFQLRGVLSGLCVYLEEPVTPESPERKFEEYNLKDILYNLPYVHRAYHSTYGNQAELFIPVLNPRIVHDKSRGKCWLELQLEPEHSNATTLGRLVGYSLDRRYRNDETYTVRRNKDFKWNAPRNKPDLLSDNRLKNYLKNRRSEMAYIFSASDLWYVKRKDLKSASVINRSTLPLTYAAMHRLSELARYEPQSLRAHLDKDASWLLSEFIEKSIVQFIDQLSCEITGNEFRMTGFRS